MFERILDWFAREPVASPKSRALHGLAATVAILLGSFVSYIQYNGYPIISSATLFALAAFGIAGLVVALLCYASNKLMILLAAGLGYLGAALFGIGWPIFGATFLGSLVALKNVKGLGFIAIMFGFVGITSPLRPQPEPFVEGAHAEGQSDLRPLVHIILDAQAPTDYTDLGYSVWTEAYSASSRTVESIPDIIIGYPELLAEKGYSVEMRHSDYYDFCNTKCSVFRNHSLDLVEELDLPDPHLIVMGSFLSQLNSHELPYQLWALNSRRALEATVARAHELKPGEAMISHVILPHSPYILVDDCGVKPVQNWTARHHDGAIEAYADQVACAKSILAELPDDVLVMVHGDHGHRRTEKELADDPKAGLNTLFAVRDGESEIHEERENLRDLVWGYVEGLPSAGGRQ